MSWRQRKFCALKSEKQNKKYCKVSRCMTLFQERTLKRTPTWWCVCWSGGPSAWAQPCVGREGVCWRPWRMVCACRSRLLPAATLPPPASSLPWTMTMTRVATTWFRGELKNQEYFTVSEQRNYSWCSEQRTVHPAQSKRLTNTTGSSHTGNTISCGVCTSWHRGTSVPQSVPRYLCAC